MRKDEKNMCVVLYSDYDDKWEFKHLKAVLKTVVPTRQLEVFTAFEGFSTRIRRLPKDIDVAVLSVRNDHQLAALLTLRDYLDSVRIILILAVRNADMVSKGHLLHPRFLAFYDGDLSDIAAVLSKMLRNNRDDGCKRHPGNLSIRTISK